VLIAAFVSFLVRFRASHGLERQRFKWLAYATALLATSLMVGRGAHGAGRARRRDQQLQRPPAVGAAHRGGFAILHDRPFDIDRVINRTLVYGTLTVLLVTAYSAGVVLLPQPIGSDSP
jgi:hypothetical protein